MPHVAQIAAALNDPERLRTFARAVLAGDDGIARDALAAAAPQGTRHVVRLAAAGLLAVDEAGTVTTRSDVFGAALATRAVDGVPAAVAALFRAGRLTDVPVRRETRLALLAHLADRVCEPDTAYSEPEVNNALRQYWPDFAALRRYLCDEGFLTRSADGLTYRHA